MKKCFDYIEILLETVKIGSKGSNCRTVDTLILCLMCAAGGNGAC